MNSKNDKEHPIKQWIKEAGYKSVSAFANVVNLDPTKMSNIFSGIRKLQPHEIDSFAHLLNKTPTEIRMATGEKVEDNPPSLPIFGCIEAEDNVVIFEVETNERIKVPFFYYKGSLIKINSKFLLPRYYYDEIIGVTVPDKKQEINSNLFGKDVIVCLPDGKMLLKIIYEGSIEDKYTLISLNPNTPPMTDTEIVWAAPIDFHLPKVKRKI